MKNQTKIRTKAELASRLGIARNTLDRFLAMPGAPDKSADGYDLAAVTEFVAENAKRESTAAAGHKKIASLRAREISLRCDRLALKLACERGELIEVAKVAQIMSRVLPPAALLLQRRLIDEWPSEVAGLDVAAARAYGRKLAADVLQALQSFADEFDK